MVNNYEGLTLEFLVRILDYTMGNIFITNRDGKIVILWDLWGSIAVACNFVGFQNFF